MTPTDLRRQDFYYELPTELIAQHPAEQRTASRLLYLHGKNKPQDLQFTDFPRLLQPNDLLVFNNTRVIKARLLGHKATGGRVECLVERLLDDHRALVHLRASNPPRPGQTLIFADGDEQATVRAKNEMGLVELAFTHPILPLLDQYGALPLPPYITHTPTADDEQRYQTVFAEQAGAVAAPTAGLHFDQAMLKMLEQQSIAQAFVTLHVGAGTFQPVRTERIADHQMHAEYFTVPAATLQAIEQTKARGGRVIAIGTTSVRALESAANLNSPNIQAHQRADGSISGDSRLFITPGYQFKYVDALLTNFHLPESTLLMLVSALAGQESIQAAYAHAVAKKYRFFSYGDAMLITQ